MTKKFEKTIYDSTDSSDKKKCHDKKYYRIR